MSAPAEILELTERFDEHAETYRAGREAERGCHDRVVEGVRRMLDLHNSLPSATSEHHRTVLQREIEATDGQIDKLVYELYGLTDEEIAIVEEATR